MKRISGNSEKDSRSERVCESEAVECESGVGFSLTGGRHGEDTDSRHAGGGGRHQDKAVTPRVPETDLEALQLENDMDRMGCMQLLNRP